MSHKESPWIRADGPGVRFSAVPYYVGPYQFALRWPAIRRALRDAIRDEDAVLMRVPSFLANCVEPALRQRRQPYGLEVLGDPYDGLAPGGIRHLLRPLLRRSLPRQLRRQCARASGVAYVSRSVLQRRYPGGGLMVGVSDAIIPTRAVADAGGYLHHALLQPIALLPGAFRPAPPRFSFRPRPLDLRGQSGAVLQRP